MLPLLNDLRMRVIEASGNSAVSNDTVFTFQQHGPMVTAQYAGGDVLCGFLVGQRTATSLLWRYIQFATDGKLDAGRDSCVIRRGASGRLQIVEHYHWETRDGTGTNVLEEVTSPPAARRWFGL